MQAERFTTKAQAALQSAQRIAQEHSNQEVDGEHLFAALLEQDDGLIQPLLQKLGAPISQISADLEAAIQKRVKVQGATSSDTFLGQALKRTLDAAESQATKLKDDYVSTEHLLLGLISEGGPALKKIFQTYGLKANDVLKALAELRGEGHDVNRKRVRRLMRLMGIEAIYQKPNTSRKHPRHKIYPYLLRNMVIDKVNKPSEN